MDTSLQTHCIHILTFRQIPLSELHVKNGTNGVYEPPWDSEFKEPQVCKTHIV